MSFLDRSDIIVFRPNQCGICGQQFRSRERYEAHYEGCRQRSDEAYARLRLFRKKMVDR